MFWPNEEEKLKGPSYFSPLTAAFCPLILRRLYLLILNTEKKELTDGFCFPVQTTEETSKPKDDERNTS